MLQNDDLSDDPTVCELLRLICTIVVKSLNDMVEYYDILKPQSFSKSQFKTYQHSLNVLIDYFDTLKRSITMN